MSNTLLGFGVFAVVAAIVGGGLKAFGFEVVVLKSTSRQILLAVAGVTLIVSAEWNQVQVLVFPPRTVTTTDSLTILEAGRVHSTRKSTQPIEEEFPFEYVHPHGANPQPFCIVAPSNGYIDKDRITFGIEHKVQYQGQGWATYKDGTKLSEATEQRACVNVSLGPVGPGGSPAQDRYPLKLKIVAPTFELVRDPMTPTRWWQFWKR